MISKRVAAMSTREGYKHRAAEASAKRFARTLSAFSHNPASVWYNMPVEVVEREKTRRVKAHNGGRQETVPVASHFAIYAGDILTRLIR